MKFNVHLNFITFNRVPKKGYVNVNVTWNQHSSVLQQYYSRVQPKGELQIYVHCKECQVLGRSE